MHLLQPSSNMQVSRKTPDAVLKHALKVIRNGYGFPSLFNADAVVEEQLRQGKTLEDAREGGCSGCVEVGAFGKEAYILTGYFNLMKMLELALHDGFDTRTGKHIGARTGDPAAFTTYDDLFAAFEAQVRHFLDIKIRGNQIIERLYATRMPHTFLSVITDDCIAKGKDYNAGGARYNNSFIQAVGIGSITDSLSALKELVFDKGELSLPGSSRSLDADFAGQEPLRQRLLNKTHKYGNDDDYADELMTRTFRMLFEAIDGRPNTKGGAYRLEMLPTTCHVYFGEVCLASADGRGEGQPLSEGISPVQGADRHGPTAVLKSAAEDGSRQDRRHAAEHEVHARACWRARAASTTCTAWCAPTSSWTATTCSSTWSPPTSCARPRPSRTSTATSSSAWRATATTSAICPRRCRTRSSSGRNTWSSSPAQGSAAQGSRPETATIGFAPGWQVLQHRHHSASRSRGISAKDAWARNLRRSISDSEALHAER